MRNLGTGKRAMNYDNSTSGFNNYMDRLEKRHPDKMKEMLGIDYSGDYGSPIEALRDKAMQEHKEAAKEASRQYKEMLKELNHKKRELLRGESSKLIL